MHTNLKSETIRNNLQDYFKNTFLNSLGRLNIRKEVIIENAKHKRPKQHILNRIDCFKKYDLYELGFIGGILHNVVVAFNRENSEEFFLYGNLECGFGIIISTEKLNQAAEDKLIFHNYYSYESRPGNSISYIKQFDINGLLCLIEDQRSGKVSID
jgi:hypothetical protein